MKHIIHIIILLVSMSGVCFAQTTDDVLFEQASKYYDAGEYDKAVPILSELAQRKHAKAINFLGVCYELGRGVKKDLKRSAQLYRQAAESGLPRAQKNLGNCYRFGKGVEKDQEKAYVCYEKAFKYYKEQAEQGDAAAQLEMGFYYFGGRLRSGTDYAKAKVWFEKSAEQGEAEAMNVLGQMFQYGYGVEKDVDRAYDCYLKGAEKGSVYAQRNLAWLFADETFRERHSSGEGDSYHEDFDFYKETEKWLRMAARKNADCMYELACFYLDMGVLDEWQGYYCEEYLRKAAEKGSGMAQACLAFNYLGEQKLDEAFVLLREAKENGTVSFSKFSYDDDNNEELKVDLMLSAAGYLSKNRQYSFKDAINQGENLMVVAHRQNAKDGLLLFSKSGKVLELSEFIYDELHYGGNYGTNNDHGLLYKDDGEDIYIDCCDCYLDVNMLNAFSLFFRQHGEMKVKRGVYRGGDAIYAVAVDGNGKSGVLKISRQSKLVDSTGFEYESANISVPGHENHGHVGMGREGLSFIGNEMDLDMVFVLSHFFSIHKEYQFMEAVYRDRNCFLVSVKQTEEGKYGWLKLSKEGKVVASTPFSNEQFYYGSYNKDGLFYSSLIGSDEKLGLDDMLSRFK